MRKPRVEASNDFRAWQSGAEEYVVAECTRRNAGAKFVECKGAIMAAVEFSLPKQWEDWCTWLLGMWLCISPWALRFDADSAATQAAVISGLLIILTELLTLSVFQSWEEWANVILGAWLIICSWILGISAWAVRTNFAVVGGLIMALALYEVWDARRKTGQ